MNGKSKAGGERGGGREKEGDEGGGGRAAKRNERRGDRRETMRRERKLCKVLDNVFFFLCRETFFLVLPRLLNLIEESKFPQLHQDAVTLCVSFFGL